MLRRVNNEKKIVYALIFLWGTVVIGWKILSIGGIIKNSVLVEDIWWTGLLLWGCMILGFIFQPMIKEMFSASLNLKDSETLMGYYPIVAVVVFLGGGLLAPVLYGSQILFKIESLHFWWATLGTGILNFFIFYFLTKGLRYGDISLVSVTQSLAPIFALPVSFIIFFLLKNHAPISNPQVTLLGAIGIFATVIALVFDALINKKRTHRTNYIPKDDWLAHHPIFCGVVSTVFSSVSINFDKVAVDSANPFLMGVVMAFTVWIISLIFNIKTQGVSRVIMIYTKYWEKFLIVGAVYGILILIMNITLVGHNVNYYGAIKRTSMVFGAFYGLYVLHEGTTQREKFTRFFVSIIVFIGVVLIVLKG